MQYLAPTWDEIYQLCVELVAALRRGGDRFDSIVAVSRGGLAPARIISDLLEIRELHVLRCEYYDLPGKRRARAAIREPISVPMQGKRVLVVDDVADTGDSLVEVQAYLRTLGVRQVVVAVLYVKPWSRFPVAFARRRTRRWIIFPWERFEVVQALRAQGASAAELAATGLSPHLLATFAQLARRPRSAARRA